MLPFEAKFAIKSLFFVEMELFVDTDSRGRLSLQMEIEIVRFFGGSKPPTYDGIMYLSCRG